MPSAMIPPPAQIPWGEEFDHECARELFGSNLLVLTWIKGEPLLGELVDDILKALKLEQEGVDERLRRSTRVSPQQTNERKSLLEQVAKLRDEESDDDSEVSSSACTS